MEFPDTTLNSALTNHLSQRLYYFLTKADLEAEKRNRSSGSDTLPRQLASSLKSSLNRDGKTHHDFEVHTAKHTPELLDLQFDNSIPSTRIIESLKISGQLVHLLNKAIRKGLENQLESSVPGNNLPSATRDFSHCLDPPEELTETYRKVISWQLIIDTTTQGTDVNRAWSYVPGAWVNRHLTVILSNGRWIILPHDAVLMIKDVIWGLFLLEAYSFLDPSRSYISKNVRFVHKWGKIALLSYGDNAYNLIKMIEPLCTAWLICLSEDILDAENQLQNMVDKYDQKEKEFRNDGTYHMPHNNQTRATVFRDFLKTLSDPNQVSELFSLAKMLGHPYIDPIKGSDALKNFARMESTATYSGVKAVGWSFCHMFTKGFIDKRKKWPPLIFNLPRNRKSKLQELHEQQHMPLPLGLSIYDPSDWDFVTFLPIDKFDYGEDILSLMSDKSLSYKRSEIDNSWAGRLPYSPEKPTSSNRVLDQLLRHDLDMAKVCEAFSRREIPMDWRVVVIHPKEREPKTPEARNFAIMTIEPRTFFCLTEANLAEKIFPFIPEQTMTMSAHDKDETFLNITQVKKMGCTLSITIDLSKWCSHFKNHNVKMIADRLNQLLGVDNLYGAVHDFFSMCIVVLRHPAFTPTQDTKGKKGNLQEEPGIYKDAETGLEGICQKLWTLITLCMLHWALWKFGLTYKITCQGDNLVVYIDITQNPSDSGLVFQEKVRSLNSRILESISTAASMIGHEVNPDECFSSTRFTTYGKDMWFKGKKLETLSKVISRMFPKTTTDVPSTESIIANIAATGTSLVERSNDSMVVFLFTKFMECLILRREFQRSTVHQTRLGDLPESIVMKTNDMGFLTLACLVPSNLGGFPISSLAEFLYRGHSDPLSSSVGSLHFLSSIQIVGKFLACLEQKTFVSVDEPCSDPGSKGFYSRRARLIRDPYAIPIRQEQGATQKTTEHVKATLRKITKNKKLVPIVSVATDSAEEERLITGLLKSTPLNPKVLHEIHKSSAFGLGNAIARRFTDTRTIRRITKSSEVDLISSHVENDFHHIRSIVKFLGRVYLTRKTDRKLHPYTLLLESRKSWGLGVLEGVTNYHPLVAGKLILLPNPSLTQVSKIVTEENNPLLVALSLKASPRKCSSERGDCVPYLGNMTSEKSISKWTKPIDSSPPLRDALRLIQLAKLCTVPGSKLRNLINRLAQDRTSLDLDVLYEISREQIGGTAHHRLNISEATRGSSAANLPNWSTHFSISSNLSRQMGAVDYPVSYSEFYLTLLVLSHWLFADQKISSPFGLIHHIDLSVLEPIQDTMLELNEDIIIKPQALPVGSYYLYAQSMTLSARSSIGKQLPVESMLIRSSGVVDALAVTCLSLLTGASRVVRKHGYSRTVISYKRIVDLPEASILSLQEYIDAASIALMLFSSRRYIMSVYKGANCTLLLQGILLEHSLLLAPLIFNTISLSTQNTDDFLRQSTGSAVSERCLIHLACVIAARAQTIMEAHPIPPPVFEQTKGSMSVSLSTRLYYLLVVKFSQNPRQIMSCKFVCKLIGVVLDRLEEEGRVAGLCFLIEKLGWRKLVFRDLKSAEHRIRSVRSRIPLPFLARDTISYSLPPLPPRSCTLTEVPLNLSTPYFMKPCDLVESWMLRPFPGRGDAYLRWSPIFNLLQPTDRVYIVGIGAGNILKCIPNECRVFGVDLPSALVGLGQSFVNYDCSGSHPLYSTRPISWLRDLSGLPNEGVRILKEDIRDCQATIVLLDLEGVDAWERVKLRQIIAKELEIRCWVKVFASREDIVSIATSVDAARANGDNWWIPKISVGTEIIFGAGDRPMGIFKGLGNAAERVITPKINPPTWDELIEFVARFGGNHSNIDSLEEFIFDRRFTLRRNEGRLTAFDVYMRALKEPEEILAIAGRLCVRMVVMVVSRLL